MKLTASALIALLTLPAAAQPATAPDADYISRVTAYARDFAKRFAGDAMLQSAVRESTRTHSKLLWDEQRNLDQDWRDELADHTRDGLVDAIDRNGLSDWLKEHMAAAPNGAVSEIRVIDGLGWNVGETSTSYDFFQGDERQWQNVLTGGADAISVSELEENSDGARTLALVSLPIVQGDANIGVATLGIDVKKLP